MNTAVNLAAPQTNASGAPAWLNGRAIFWAGLLPSSVFAAGYLIELLIALARHPAGLNDASGTDIFLFLATSSVIFLLTFFHAVVGQGVGLLLDYLLRKTTEFHANKKFVFAFGAFYGVFITYYLAAGFFGAILAIFVGLFLGLGTAFVFLRRSDILQK